MRGRAWSIVTSLLVLVLAGLSSSAEAAFPGENGKIAFTRGSGCFDRAIHVIDPDGTDETQLTAPGENGWEPNWSPDGTRIAFNAFPAGDSCLHPQIYVMNADGTGRTRLTFNAHSDDSPTWSPDGQRIAFVREGPPEGECSVKPRHIWTMNADGTSLAQVTSGSGSVSGPEWSPDGHWIVYTVRFTTYDPEDFCTPSSSGDQLLVRNVDTGLTYGVDTMLGGPRWSPDSKKYAIHGGPQGDVFLVSAPFGPQVDGDTQQITNTPSVAESAATLSPDNSKLAYNSSPPQQILIVANSDGSGATQIATQAGGPDWQPVQRPHVRPKGATPVRVPLVPAYVQCTAPNRTHGPPLAFPSCNPPVPGSSRLTIGVGDGSSAFARGSGFVRMEVLVGAPGPPDDSDVNIRFNLTNVMRASDLSDYTGGLRTEVTVRRTDREVVGGASTSNDFAFGFSALCTGTPSTLDASTCNAFTSVNAIVPGAITDGRRAIWALDKVRVYDGGPDEDADTDVNRSLFMTQGVFVP